MTITKDQALTILDALSCCDNGSAASPEDYILAEDILSAFPGINPVMRRLLDTPREYANGQRNTSQLTRIQAARMIVQSRSNQSV